jgi:uncharacterized membrane protein YhaH (DUF805 family)
MPSPSAKREEGVMTYEQLYTYPAGCTSRADFRGALAVLLAATVFYVLLANPGLNKDWVLATLMLPALALHARRLHDMGQPAWLLLAPAIADGVAMALYMMKVKSDLQIGLTFFAVALTVGFMAWGALGKGQAEA